MTSTAKPTREASVQQPTSQKRPSFQLYPNDWLTDMGLRACSLAARGLWADMLCLMHQGKPYGHLTVASKEGDKDILRPILPSVLARIVGGMEKEVEDLLAELETFGVFSRTEEGVIYSRRMVRDEKLRQVRAAGGFESQMNPNVPRAKSKERTTGRISSDPSLGGSPSSSSSSSSSKPTTEGAVIIFPLNDGSEFPVTEIQVQQWADLFPAVDVVRQLRAMRAWLDANPTRRKTNKGILRFCVNWLQKEQDRAPRPAGTTTPANGNRRAFRNVDRTPPPLNPKAAEILDREQAKAAGGPQ